MQRKEGVLVGAGRGDLREDGFFVHEVPADAHDRLREGRDQVRTERLAGDQV